MSISYKTMVCERPVCFWYDDLVSRNASFLAKNRPVLLEKICKILIDQFEKDENDLTIGTMIRTYYAQGVEALFALIFAVLQSPHFLEGWLSQYYVEDLREMVSRIDEGFKIPTIHGNRSFTWDDISEIIYNGECEKEKKKKIVKGYALLFRRLAYEYCNDDLGIEYNSIKHGNRVTLGGVFLSVGKEKSPGVLADGEIMHSMGGSRFGTTFMEPVLLFEKGHEFRKTHLAFNEKTVNWEPTQLLKRMSIMSMAMSNILSRSQLLSQSERNKAEFVHPIDLSAFEDSLESHLGALGFTTQSTVTKEEIMQSGINKEEIINLYYNN